MRRLTLLVLLLAAAVAAPSAHAAVPVTCPTAMPLDAVKAEANDPAGFEATGFTVSRQNEIDDFAVTVLGVLKDGVGIGKDMIIVNVHGYPVMDDHAHGIWAGMSGSPVYADDGRLIGAVAFGLAFGPSTIGGVTPAQDMLNVLNMPQPAAAPRSVRAGAQLQQKMVATGAVTAHQAASRFEQLPIPLGITGLSANRLQTVADRLPGSQRFIPFRAGGAGLAAGPGDPAAIVGGGNFAAALSYGDIAAAGVGTTTAVCGNKVVAFGHPMNFDGPTALSAHNADAIVIQDDPTLTPFKLANIGGFVGTIDQDRISGIRALLGPEPTPVAVTSHVTDDGGAPDAGETDVNRTIYVPDLAAAHLLGNVDSVINRIGGGRASLGWTVTGTADGEQFSMSRNNKFADRGDISFASIDEMFGMLATIVDNPFTDVTLKTVDMTSAVQSQYRAYEITGLEQLQGSTWVKIGGSDTITLTPGVPLRVRVLLQNFRSSAPVAPVELTFPIADDATGDGSLDITGGSDGGGGDEGGGSGGSSDTSPTTFKDLLNSLSDAPRNDDLTGSLSLFGSGGGGGRGGGEIPPPPAFLDTSSPAPATVKKQLAEVVTGALSIPVTVQGSEPQPSPGPELNLSGKASARLAKALKKGLHLTVRSSAPGRLVVKVTVDKKTARRLKLKKNAKGPVVVASLVKLIGDGRSRVTVKFTKKAKKRLKHAKRVKLSIKATITDLDGNRTTDRAKMVLTRKTH